MLKRQMARHYVLASYDRRRNMSSEMLDHIRRQFGSDVCKLIFAENVTVAEELRRCGFI